MSGSHLPIEKLLDNGRFQGPQDDEDARAASTSASEAPGDDREPQVEIASIADLPTRFGDFHIVAFWNNRDGKDHVALVRGDVAGAENVPVRLHSECLTGDALGSLRCDCRDQLEAALTAIGQMERGIVLYLRQEGRGIGLLNKIRAYGLQDYGYDTVEANLALGFRDDERDYAVAAQMLRALQVRSICLMTNNPKKLEGLAKHGVTLTGRIPHVMPPNPHNEFYLRTKAEKSGHLIAFPGDEHQNEPPRTSLAASSDDPEDAQSADGPQGSATATATRGQRLSIVRPQRTQNRGQTRGQSRGQSRPARSRANGGRRRWA